MWTAADTLHVSISPSTRRCGMPKTTKASFLPRGVWQAVLLEQCLGSKRVKTQWNRMEELVPAATRHSEDCGLESATSMLSGLLFWIWSRALKKIVFPCSGCGRHGVACYWHAWTSCWANEVSPAYSTLSTGRGCHDGYSTKELERWAATESHWFLCVQPPPGLFSWWEHNFLRYWHAEAWSCLDAPVGHGWAKPTALARSTFFCSGGGLAQPSLCTRINLPETFTLFQDKGYSILTAKLVNRHLETTEGIPDFVWFCS